MSLEYKIDLSDIGSSYIRENYIFALGFPQSSGNTEYVVLRAIATGKPNIWLYDPFAEGMLSNNGTTIVNNSIAGANSQNGISGHTYIDAQIPSSKYVLNDKTFVFNVEPTRSKYGFLYQLFFGISPSFLRVTFQQPFNTAQMGLPPQNPNSTYNQFGAILGDMTPLDRPAPVSEIFVPPALNFGIGFINDTPRAAKPLISWVINYLKYEIITDVDLVYEVLHTTKYRPRTVGGISGYSYSTKNYFGVDPVTLGMDKSSIGNAIGGI